MITLKYNGAEMQIAHTGAEMRAYRDKTGRDWLWSGNPEIWKGVAPILFPTIGALKNNGATIAGEWYDLPRHGFVRPMTFDVTAQGEDFVTLTVRETAETQKVFPFAFALSVTHRFVENGFETRFEVVNHSDRAMPFLLGGHPAFACPMHPGERFEDYVLHFEKEEAGQTTLATNPSHTLCGTEPVDFGADRRTLALDYAAFNRLDTYIFPGLNSRTVDLVHRETGRGLRFCFDMDVLAIWTPPGKKAPYVCIEPWQGCPAYADESGRFEDKPWHVELAPGQSYTCAYQAVSLENI